MNGEQKLRVENFKCDEDFINYVKNHITFFDATDVIEETAKLNILRLSKLYINISNEFNILKILIELYDQWYLSEWYEKHNEEDGVDLEFSKDHYDAFKLLNNTRLYLVELQSEVSVGLLYVEQFLMNLGLYSSNHEEDFINYN